MKHLPLLIILASPAAAVTTLDPINPPDVTQLLVRWTMTPGATDHVWATETGTFTIEVEPNTDWFSIRYDRAQYVPGYRAHAWWEVLAEDGTQLDHGDVVDQGGCPTSGGWAMREGRVETWAVCGEGYSVILPPDDPSPVPLPAAGLLLLAGLAGLWRVRG